MLGKDSKLKLATSHAELRQLIEAVAAGVDAGDLVWAGVRDISVACGYRGEKEQNGAVARGASKTPWPRSKHNRVPSDAVDVWPFPVRWDGEGQRQFAALHAYVRGVARALGIRLHTVVFSDGTVDLPHIQRDVP